MLAVADREHSLIITGNGDVLEPEDGMVAIGSGGAYAQAAARACWRHTELDAETIVKQGAGDRRRHLHLHQPAHDRGAGTDEPLHDPAGDRLRARPPHRRPERRQARRRHRLRNRWRRQQVAEPLREEITPKNILMIGPTGVGKTEIARRLARLANAPFIKVEATKFTEVGYVGRDVEQIIRDLVEIAIKHDARAPASEVRPAEDAAEERVLDALVPAARAGEESDAANAPPEIQEAARGRARRQGDRDRGGRARRRQCRPSTFPACPARSMGMLNRSRTCSARPSAASAARRASA
jgi:hypothetical protein